MEFKNQMDDVIVEAHKDKQNSISYSKFASFFKESLTSALKHGKSFQPGKSISY